jgi:hypothetical protein
VNRREEAALRVRSLHPPLTALFAALRAETGVAAPEPDPLERALVTTAADGAYDAETLSLQLALAADEVLGGEASDALLVVLAPFAEAVAGGASATPSPELLDRLRAVARNAAVVASARAGGTVAVQRFGEPFCPRDACYGRDGAPLTDEWVRAEGVPPYGDGCNCTVVLAGA